MGSALCNSRERLWTRRQPGAQDACDIAEVHNAVAVGVIQVWPDLPEAIRAGIVAMVRASH